MKRFLSDLFGRVFGCSHSNVSRPFTLRSRTYRVCCDCGTEFDYSLQTMSFIRPVQVPSIHEWRRRPIVGAIK